MEMSKWTLQFIKRLLSSVRNALKSSIPWLSYFPCRCDYSCEKLQVLRLSHRLRILFFVGSKRFCRALRPFFSFSTTNARSIGGTGTPLRAATAVARASPGCPCAAPRSPYPVLASPCLPPLIGGSPWGARPGTSACWSGTWAWGCAPSWRPGASSPSLWILQQTITGG